MHTIPCFRPWNELIAVNLDILDCGSVELKIESRKHCRHDKVQFGPSKANNVTWLVNGENWPIKNTKITSQLTFGRYNSAYLSKKVQSISPAFSARQDPPSAPGERQ